MFNSILHKNNEENIKFLELLAYKKPLSSTKHHQFLDHIKVPYLVKAQCAGESSFIFLELWTFTIQYAKSIMFVEISYMSCMTTFGGLLKIHIGAKSWEENAIQGNYLLILFSQCLLEYYSFSISIYPTGKY